MIEVPEATNQRDHERAPSTSELLVQLALERYRFGVDAQGEPFAVRKDGPNVALMLKGSRDALRASLSRHFRKVYERTPNAAALGDALLNLQGEAIEAAREPTYLRVANYGDGIVIDLSTTDGRAVVVSSDGWSVVDKSPVLFRRTALTAPFAEPTRGGDLGALRELLNVDDENWALIQGWLVAAFIPEIPHPILMLGGEAGSGKSTAARMLVGLFDPTSAPLRSQPADVEQWALQANGSSGIAVDNVSSIPAWWSDCLCKAVTGDAWVRRRLYTDGELSVVAFRRVVILTSIDAGALRGDLGSRVLLCDIDHIPSHRRRGEAELDAAYQRLRPLIFGATLDLLSRVLHALPTIRPEQLLDKSGTDDLRMYDFVRVLAAIDQLRGTNAVATHAEQRQRIAADVVDADPISKAIIALVERNGDDWSGTMGELLTALSPNPVPRYWPETPRALSGRIKRAAPALRAMGIEVERGRRGPGRKRERLVTIGKGGVTTVRTVQSVRDASGGPGNSGSPRTVARCTDSRDVSGGSDRPADDTAGAREPGLSDRADDSDGSIGHVFVDEGSDATQSAIVANRGEPTRAALGGARIDEP